MSNLGGKTSQNITLLIIDPHVRSEGGLAGQFDEDDSTVGALYEVREVSEALTVLSEENIDCVISLHQPPKIDAITVLSSLREEYPRLPVLVATETDQLDDAVGIGATDLVQLDEGELHTGMVTNRIGAIVAQGRERDRYEQLFKRANDGIAIYDPDTDAVLEANSSFYELIGVNPQESSSPTLSEIFSHGDEYPESDNDELIQRIKEEPQTVEWSDRTRNGEMRWIEAKLERTILGGEERIFASVRDVTPSRKHTRILDGLLDRSREFLRATDVDEVASLTIKTAEEVLDYPITGMRQHDSESETLPPTAISDEVAERMDDIPTYGADEGIVGEAFQSGDPVFVSYLDDATKYEYGSVESAMILPIGEYGTLSIGATEPDAFTEEDQALAGLLTTTATAAFDRLEHEATLHLHRHVLEHVEDMVFLLDDEGRFRLATKPLVERLGLEDTSLSQTSFTDLLADDAVDQFEEQLAKFGGQSGTTHVSCETTALTTGGDEVPLKIDLTALPDEADENGIIGTATDITLRRQSERELERNRDRLRRTAHLADVGGWEVDFQSDTLYWTNGTREIYQVDDSYDPSLSEAINFFHPKDRPKIRNAIEHSHKTGDPYDIEARIVTGEDRQRWVRATGETVEEDGEIVALLGAVRDITIQKEREQQLSVLYRIMRHNLRNDLNIVHGTCGPLIDSIEQLDPPDVIAGRELDIFDRAVRNNGSEADDAVAALRDVIEVHSAMSFDELRSHVERIQTASDNLITLGEKAQRFEKLITTNTATGSANSANEVVEAALDQIHTQYPDASIDEDGVDDVAVRGDREKVVTLLKELVENAVIHAGDETDPVEVWTECRETNVVIAIADYGPGISEYELEVLEQGNEKSLIHGSGIGLWIVNWLVGRLGGDLLFETGDSFGTVVKVALPSGQADDEGGSEELFAALDSLSDTDAGETPTKDEQGDK